MSNLNLGKVTFENNFQVVLVPTKKFPFVAINMLYDVTAEDEPKGKRGIRHFIEHLFNRSTPLFAKVPYSSILQSAAGDVGALTSYDYVMFTETISPEQLELALIVESDRMASLLKLLDFNTLENEKKIVRNEKRQRASHPLVSFDDAINDAVFPPPHPYHGSPLGSHETIQSISHADIESFYSAHFHASAASMVIVGNFDRGSVLDKVGKYFAHLRKGSVPERHVVHSDLPEIRHLVLTDSISYPTLYMSWRLDPIFSKHYAVAKLCELLLAKGGNSMLQKGLVQTMAAQWSLIQYSANRHASIFTIESTLSSGSSLEEVQKVIFDVINKMASGSVGEAQLSGIKNAYQLEVLDRWDSASFTARMLNIYNLYTRDPNYFSEDLRRIRSVSHEDIIRFTERELASSRVLRLDGLPGDRITEDDPRVPRSDNGVRRVVSRSPSPKSWRANVKIPKESPNNNNVIPAFRAFSLSNKLKVYHMEIPKLGFVTASLTCHAGIDENPQSLPGLSIFVNHLLLKGGISHDEAFLNRLISEKAIDLQPSVLKDGVNLTVTALKKYLNLAIEALANMVRSPRLDPQDIAILRRRLSTALKRNRDLPYYIAFQILQRRVFGQLHPYAYLNYGTSKSIEAITHKNVTDFHENCYQADNAALAIAGDIDKDELTKIVLPLWQDWQGRSAIPDWHREIVSDPAKTVICDRPLSPLATIVLGHLSCAYAHPDSVKVLVLSRILSDRLDRLLKRKFGFTYSVTTDFIRRKEAGLFCAQLKTPSDETLPALSEIRGAIGRIQKNVTQDELNMGKNQVRWEIIRSFGRTKSALKALSQLFVYDLAESYYTQLLSSLETTSSHDIIDAARRHLTPKDIQTVIIGPGTELRSHFDAAGLDTVEYVSE